MAEAAKSIFNKRATEKLRSPDDLDKYLQITNPSVWVVLAACVALLAGLLAWGIFGAVTTSVSTTGVCVNGNVMCFLAGEDASKVHVGDVANVDGNHMSVASVSSVPLSRKEAGDTLKSDYLVSTLLEGDWAYLVKFEGSAENLADSVPLSVQITTERIPPLSLLLKNWE
jgi:hypothetical protein